MTACILALTLFAAIVPQAPAAQAATADGERIVVSLGDSYSSGEGIEKFYGQDKPLAERVKDHDWLAHRSEQSWPGKLYVPGICTSNNDTLANHRDENWFFVAASGATTEHLNESQTKDYNKYSGLKPYKDDEDLAPQLDIFDQLEEGSVDYVTMTMGGNDAGFSKIIQDAVVGGYYTDFAGLSNRLNDTWNEFYRTGGIRDKLYQAYHDIQDAAGEQARIIIAGYPKLLEESGEGVPFAEPESDMINESVSAFNDEIENIVNTCKQEEMLICFVSVEEAFSGHEAYSKNSWINPVYFGPILKEQDLHWRGYSSDYSMHPNAEGAQAYADCVNKKIKEIEADGGASEWPAQASSAEREIVLVLDASGSMSGEPLQQTKIAANDFIEAVVREEAAVGVVAYDDTAWKVSGFTTSSYQLANAVNNIHDGGGTNMEAGLLAAEEMLQDSPAKKRIIVLMSDGCPNEGKTDEELIAYADTLKEKGILIYTLGFFSGLGSTATYAESLLRAIADEGCFYNVSDANDLVFLFGDMADQLNGQKYIYVRIACPVEVTVSHDGQTLCSDEDDLCTRTDFGTLTFETIEGEEDSAKILRLKEGVKYDIRIEGTGRGRMAYTIGFVDDEGEYTDMRKFSNIKITRDTVIDTVAEPADTTTLKVDEDGDGRYDLTYKAQANSRGELVDYTVWWVLGGVAVGILLVLVAVLVLLGMRRKKKTMQGGI